MNISTAMNSTVQQSTLSPSMYTQQRAVEHYTSEPKVLESDLETRNYTNDDINKALETMSKYTKYRLDFRVNKEDSKIEITIFDQDNKLIRMIPPDPSKEMIARALSENFPNYILKEQV